MDLNCRLQPSPFAQTPNSKQQVDTNLKWQRLRSLLVWGFAPTDILLRNLISAPDSALALSPGSRLVPSSPSLVLTLLGCLGQLILLLLAGVNGWSLLRYGARSFPFQYSPPNSQ